MSQSFSLPFKTTLLIIVSAACFSSAVISPCLPFMAESFHIAYNQITQLVSVFLFGYISGQIVYSLLSQFTGYKTALTSGFLIYIFSTIAQIIAIQFSLFDLLFYSRFTCALGASSGLICVFAMINELSENKEEAQKLLSLAFISLTVFAYFSITLGGILAHYLSWQSVFYLMFIISIVEFILIYRYIPYAKKRTIKSKNYYSEIGSNYLSSLFNYRLILPSLVVAFTTTSTYLYNAVVPKMSASLFHLSPSLFGIISLLNLLGLVSGGWLSSKLINNYGISNSLLYGLFISLIPIGTLFLFDTIVFNSNSSGLLFFTTTALLNFGLGIIYPTASYLALNSIHCNSTASSIMNLFKIACPAFIIYCISKFNMELISSYRIPLILIFIVALLSCVTIKLNESRIQFTKAIRS